MFQSLHGQLADVCVAFIILTISHHHHLPSNHLCIADILVALSMFLFFDSIIQNYFTGIKIVYINYGFFLQLPIYIYTCILENTVGKYIFSEYKKCFGNLNASQCEVNWQGSTFFTRNWTQNWRVLWKQCVEWTLSFNKFIYSWRYRLSLMFSKGTKWTIT